MSSSEVADLKASVTELKASVAELKASQIRIETAMIGDDSIGQDGVVPTSRDHEKRITFLERCFTSVAGAVSVTMIYYGLAKDYFGVFHSSK